MPSFPTADAEPPTQKHRWLVTFDDNVVVNAATAKEAVELACDDPGDWFTLGATVYAIDLDRIDGTAAIAHLQVGLHEVTEIDG